MGVISRAVGRAFRGKSLILDNVGVISRVVGYAFQSKSLVFDNVAAVSGECGLVLLKIPWLLKN